MKIIECPRDAMQGIKDFIPTAQKVAYLNSLLKVGFDTLDFGSFVSPKAIPQMRDTANVLSQLDDSNTSLLAIVANQRGADEACSFERINFIGYPFSISEILPKALVIFSFIIFFDLKKDPKFNIILEEIFLPIFIPTNLITKNIEYINIASKIYLIVFI